MHRFLAIFGLVILTCLATATLHAASYTWDSGGGADNNFNTAANWSSDIVPVATDTAAIDNGATALVTQNNTVTYLRAGYAASTTGCVEITGGTLTVSTYLQFGYNASAIGVLRQSGGSLIAGAGQTSFNRIGYNNTAAYGYYELSGGEALMGGLIVSTGGSVTNPTTPCSGVFNQTGGSFTADSSNASFTDFPGLRIGTNNGAVGAYNLSGGTCYVRNLYAGGSGAYREGVGQVNISGTGQLTVSPTIGSNSGLVRLGYRALNSTTLSDGAVNLATGGTFAAPMLRSGSGTDPLTIGRGYLNFHGGTLVTNADQTDYLQSLNAYVYDKDARINTDGHAVTFNNPILAATDYGVDTIALTPGAGYVGPPVVQITGGSGHGAMAIANVVGNTVTSLTITNPGSGYLVGDTLTATLYGGGSATATLGTVTLVANDSTGGLVKLGSGTLTLNAANTYKGETLISAGTLALGASGSIASSSRINVGVDSFFDVSAVDFTLGGTQVLKGNGTVIGDIATAAGSIVAPGASIGSLTVSGSADLNGSWSVEYNGADPETNPIDMLTVSGTLDLDGATLDFVDLGAGAPLAGPAYVFATYGTLAGTPLAVNNLPTGYHVDYQYGIDGKSIALVVPEPSTLVLLGLLGVCSLGMRRRD